MGNAIVMIVDDEPLALTAMARVLGNAQYKIVTARSGTEALDLIGGLLGASVKLLLLDMSLTDMSGITLAHEVRKLIPDVKVLYVSGYPPTRGLADCWFEKPFDVDALKARILQELFGE
jgi:two-component system cell cycle sensor histidine kinase/response regulator CckA